DVTGHFDQVTETMNAFILSRYVGFFAVASISVIELAYKDIMIDFANRTHATFAVFLSSHYDRLNARVKLTHINGDLEKFGGPFLSRFTEQLNHVHSHEVRNNSFSV